MNLTDFIEEEKKELLALLDNPRTGLRDSSDTNKTRYAALAILESSLHRYREHILEMIAEEERGPTLCGDCDMQGLLCTRCYANRQTNSALDLISSKLKEGI